MKILQIIRSWATIKSKRKFNLGDNVYFYTNLCEDFVCGMCGQCCRNDWQVTLNQENYERNREYFYKTGRKGEFQQVFIPIRGRKSPGEFAYVAKSPLGGCWFLNEQNLCRLQCEVGPTALDIVCQTFPRYPMNTARGVELTLSFSCTKVLETVGNLIDPLMVIRAEQPPFLLPKDNFVEEIHPEQYSRFRPLHYYFELERHIMDILQWRKAALEKRLTLLQKTVETVESFSGKDRLGEKLTKLIYHNYDRMDAAVDEGESVTKADILVEHFLVNFVFKKPFYNYGLIKTLAVIQSMWKELRMAWQEEPGIADFEKTKDVIMAIEFTYSHNRQAFRQLF